MLRKIEQHDIEYIYSLWKKHFPLPIVKKREVAFETILFSNPFSTTKNGYYVLEEDDEIIAYEGVMPYKFQILNKCYEGTIFQDTMVNPKMRGKGVGTQLVRDVMAETKGVSIAVWMNAPNNHVFNNCGWKTVHHIHSFARGYNVHPVLPIKNKSLKSALAAVVNAIIAVVYRMEKLFYRKALRRHRVEEIKQFDSRLDAFFDSVKNQFPFICYRTGEALNWKYAKSYGPEFTKLVCVANDDIQGYMVSTVRESEDGKVNGTIFDFLTDPDDMEVFQSLLKCTIQKMERHRPDLIEVLCTDPRFHRGLRKHGFLLKKPKDFALKYVHDEEIEGGVDLSQSRNWFFTFGDGDKVFWDF